MYREEIPRIIDSLAANIGRWTRVDLYLHDHVAKGDGPDGLELGPGCGFASVIPILHRPFTQMLYTEEWNLDKRPVGFPRFWEVAANEIVKAYLFTMQPRMASLLRSTTMGWIEEGMAAYLQANTFDDQDIDTWAVAAMQVGLGLSVHQLLPSKFPDSEWTEDDQIVFDTLLMRQLGSFWRFWNQQHGMKLFRDFYRRAYQRAGVAMAFERRYPQTLAQAEEAWRNSLGNEAVGSIAEEVVRAAFKPAKRCQWRALLG
jgi:hypothetical protein